MIPNVPNDETFCWKSRGFAIVFKIMTNTYSYKLQKIFLSAAITSALLCGVSFISQAATNDSGDAFTANTVGDMPALTPRLTSELLGEPTEEPTAVLTVVPTAVLTATPIVSTTPTSTITSTSTQTPIVTMIATAGKGLVIFYPNPAKGREAYFNFNLDGAGRVFTSIYNVIGERIATFNQSYPSGGSKVYRWNIEGIAPGIYYYHVKVTGDAGKQMSEKKKLVIIK